MPPRVPWAVTTRPTARNLRWAAVSAATSPRFRTPFDRIKHGAVWVFYLLAHAASTHTHARTRIPRYQPVPRNGNHQAHHNTAVLRTGGVSSATGYVVVGYGFACCVYAGCGV